MPIEEKIQGAVKGIMEGIFLSIRRAAPFFEISESTWRHRYN